jgi:hypothetical protein
MRYKSSRVITLLSMGWLILKKNTSFRKTLGDVMGSTPICSIKRVHGVAALHI